MTPQKRKSSERRTDALSRERIVEAAIDLLDTAGEGGLTFRALSERLATGPGAIYWHVANRDELVALAADQVLGDALALTRVPTDDAGTGLRTLAIAVFDALDRHPWAAARVTTPAALPNALCLLDRIGTLVTRTAVPADRRFAVATAVFYYVTGVSAQIILPGTAVDVTTTRDVFLARAAERWENLAPSDFPFLTQAAADLRDHDDRLQFIAGLDLLLAGLGGTSAP